MKIKIRIQDNRGQEEAELKGIPWEPTFELTDFHFHPDQIRSFWIDHTDDEIVFSYDGADYRTPYTEKKHEAFKKLFND